MIISRSPVRIPLGGGGTDLPSYYEKYDGFLIAGAINKYLIIEANKQFYDTIILKYSKLEVVSSINEIKHPLFREALKYTKINGQIEIASLSDIPAGSGLGSSGAFLVALLNTLHQFKQENITKRQLAEEACQIEIDIMKEHEGKQDKYASAFGGIRAYKFHKNGNVSVIPLTNEDIIKIELENKLHIYFTGLTRSGTASDSLKRQDIKVKEDNEEMTNYLHTIKRIGYETVSAFQDLDFDRFGRLLNDHWKIKQKMNPPKNNQITKIYDYAIKHGAIGGKIMGANTDVGFFMFYHPGSEKKLWEFNDIMLKQGLKHMPFKFDMEGTMTLFRGE
jgi:D-glycero-alpha-D-manno-heptose-7-phosphate kinase